MLYYVYITQNGEPKTGLSPDFQSLLTAQNGTDKSGSAPTISAVGGGIYKFSVAYGSGPWDVMTEDLVGVIDADPTDAESMNASERYIPVVITLRGLALVRLTHKAEQDKSSGTITVYAANGTDEEMRLIMADGTSVISRTPGAAQ
jgi:hypothetical protein